MLIEAPRDARGGGLRGAVTLGGAEGAARLGSRDLGGDRRARTRGGRFIPARRRGASPRALRGRAPGHGTRNLLLSELGSARVLRRPGARNAQAKRAYGTHLVCGLCHWRGTVFARPLAAPSFGRGPRRRSRVVRQRSES